MDCASNSKGCPDVLPGSAPEGESYESALGLDDGKNYNLSGQVVCRALLCCSLHSF